jgi:hypothetical protein
VGAGRLVGVDDQDVALPLDHVGAFDHRLGHVRIADHARGAERLHQADALDAGGIGGGAPLGGVVVPLLAPLGVLGLVEQLGRVLGAQAALGHVLKDGSLPLVHAHLHSCHACLIK